MTLFLADDGKVLVPTARHVGDQRLATNPMILSTRNNEESQITFTQLQKVAEEHGKPIYEELAQEQKNHILREREKANYAYAARRKNLERIGLPQVRNYRLNKLEQEEKAFQEQLDDKSQSFPEMVPLLIVRVEGSA